MDLKYGLLLCMGFIMVVVFGLLKIHQGSILGDHRIYFRSTAPDSRFCGLGSSGFQG